MQSLHLGRLAASGMGIILVAASAASAQNVHVSGVVYSQYAYQLSDTAGQGNNFDVTRAYVNVLGRFPHGIGTRVTADVHRNDDGSLGYRLKYAFVTYTPEHSPLTFKFGQIHTAWIDWEEALYDYRMQGPVAIERAGYMTSADLGAGVDGQWHDNAFNFQVAMVNGEGYSHAPGDKRKDAQARASIRLARTNDMGRAGGLRLTAFANVGAYTGSGDRDRWIGMLSYRSQRVTLAGEYAATVDAGGAPGAPNIDGRFISGFGILHVGDSPWAVLARVDAVDPDTGLTGDSHTVYIGGLSYQLSPNLRLLGDLDYTHYQTTPLPPAVEASRSRALFQVQFTY